jgi:hypothetical protein
MYRVYAIFVNWFAEESNDLWSAYILAQTEGDTGYDYDDVFYDGLYEYPGQVN